MVLLVTRACALWHSAGIAPFVKPSRQGLTAVEHTATWRDLKWTVSPPQPCANATLISDLLRHPLHTAIVIFTQELVLITSEIWIKEAVCKDT